MKLRGCARGLLAAAVTGIAVASGTGIAHADPDDVLPAPGPAIVNQILTETPALAQDPHDRDNPRTYWGGTGMYCENRWARCQ
jgi:hypothetical protein